MHKVLKPISSFFFFFWQNKKCRQKNAKNETHIHQFTQEHNHMHIDTNTQIDTTSTLKYIIHTNTHTPIWHTSLSDSDILSQHTSPKNQYLAQHTYIHTLTDTHLTYIYITGNGPIYINVFGSRNLRNLDFPYVLCTHFFEKDPAFYSFIFETSNLKENAVNYKYSSEIISHNFWNLF